MCKLNKSLLQGATEYDADHTSVFSCSLAVLKYLYTTNFSRWDVVKKPDILCVQ